MKKKRNLVNSQRKQFFIFKFLTQFWNRGQLMMNEKQAEALRPPQVSPYRKRHQVNHRIEAVKELAEAIRSHVEGLREEIVTAPLPLSEPDDIKFYDEVRYFEIGLIERALKRTGGHQLYAARMLGLKATTLNNMIKRYNISPKLGRITNGGDEPARQMEDQA